MKLISAVEEAIVVTESKIAAHRAEAHHGSQDLFGCALRGAFEHRLSGLRLHKECGGRFIFVKGSRVDPVTEEMSVSWIGGSVG